MSLFKIGNFWRNYSIFVFLCAHLLCYCVGIDVLALSSLLGLFFCYNLLVNFFNVYSELGSSRIECIA